MKSRAASVQTAAAGTMKSISTALAGYQTDYGTFPPTLAALGGTCPGAPPSVTADCQLADEIAKGVSSGPYQGYTWTYTISGPTFSLSADPAPSSSTYVVRHYLLSDSLVIHKNDTAPATSTDPIL